MHPQIESKRWWRNNHRKRGDRQEQSHGSNWLAYASPVPHHHSRRDPSMHLFMPSSWSSTRSTTLPPFSCCKRRTKPNDDALLFFPLSTIASSCCNSAPTRTVHPPTDRQISRQCCMYKKWKKEIKKCAAEEERSLIQLCDDFSAFSTVYANAIVFLFCIILFRVSSMARHRGFFCCWS